MAISQVGSAVVGTTTSTWPDTAYTVNKPSGVASGDFLLVTCTNDSGDLRDIDDTSFTLRVNLTTSDQRLQTFWKIADGTEGTSVTLTDHASYGFQSAAIYSAWGGVDGTTPFDVADVTAQGTTISVGSITPVTDGAELLLVSGPDANGTCSALSANNGFGGDAATYGLASFFTYNYVPIALWGQLQSTAAATGTTTITVTTSTSDSNNVIMALRPASSGYTITAVGGTFTVTGTAASLTRALEIVASGGTFTFSGLDAALQLGYQIAASGGGWTISGLDASLLYAIIMAADTTAFTVTGTDATLTYTIDMPAATTAFGTTGSDVSFLYDRVLTAESGSFGVSGTASSLEANWMVASAAGSYGWSGSAVTFLYSRAVTADNGAFTFTGANAELLYSGAPQPTGGGGSMFMKNIVNRIRNR